VQVHEGHRRFLVSSLSQLGSTRRPSHADDPLSPRRTRDLSLVEKVQGSPTGTICFATTSVVTPKVPRVAGRVRASIALNGWVLEPTDDGTKVSY